ncbi:P-loop containing nucleoside triphosphate hydrolase protein, partial [Dimargaris cristalligena]
PPVSFLSLFRFATVFDWLLMMIGTICAMAVGASQPLMAIIFGSILQNLGSYTYNYQTDPDLANAQLEQTIHDMLKWVGILAGATFTAAFVQIFMWSYAAERQCRNIRELYYASILRQEIAWFDTVSTGDLTSRISGDVNMLQEGIGSKLSIIVQDCTCFVTGFIVAFVKGWRLALVLMSSLPLLILCGTIMSKLVAARSTQGQDSYAGAGAVAEEVISGIRTVMAFGGQEREAERYEGKVRGALRQGIRNAYISGLGVGCMMLLVFLTYALGFWYAIKLTAEGTLQGDQAIAVFFALVLGATALGRSTPSFSALANARGAAGQVFQLIARERLIDPLANTGLTLDRVEGRCEFRAVQFNYPSRPDVPILKGLTLDVDPGQTVALVGPSGSGKSTIVALLERFYDPSAGAIFLDRVDIKDINVRSLRSHIGVVSQEPVLFGETIRQNVLWGTLDDPTGPPVTDSQIEKACRDANAWDFIQNLPQGLDSPVGERGTFLSGGQKQRIAIARAIIRNPRILLLDEATSALDSKAERLVQDALDRVAQNRTTIVVAHRLSTIRNVDKIVVMQQGEVVEVGTHNALLARDGTYAQLVRSQAIKKREDGVDDTFLEPDDDIDEEDDPYDTQRTALAVVGAALKNNTSFAGSDDVVTVQNLSVAEKVLRKPLSHNWPALLSRIMAVFSNVANPVQMRTDGDFYSLMFVVLAIVAFIAATGRVGLFAMSGERLTYRLRLASFRAIIYQDAAFFDDRANGTGTLCSKLATESERVKTLCGRVIGTLLQNSSTFLVGVTLAFVNGWQLALVVMACTPIPALGSIMQMKRLEGFDGKTKKAYDRAAQTASETVANLRTVATLGREQMFIDMFKRSNDQPHYDSLRGFLFDSFGSALAQSQIFIMVIISFYYGSRLVLWGIYDLADVLQVIYAIIFAAQSIAQAGQQVSDLPKAKVAALSIFEIMDRVPAIDARQDDGQARPHIEGFVDAHEVNFSYPSSPDTPILQHINLTAHPGQTIALVGNSGSGKSTLIALAQRLYDVTAGAVSIEHVDTREWHLANLRSHMALVGQEPVLFDLSIRDNIRYGRPQATDAEIEQAARSANIHEFIESLPDGYLTTVGERGGQLSGGQKQRLAIARAL